MMKRISILTVACCIACAGQLFAGNPAASLTGKSATVQPFHKFANGKATKQLRSSGIDLRSVIEVAQSRPVSSVTVHSGEAMKKSTFFYRKDTVEETVYFKLEDDPDWDLSRYMKEETAYDAMGNLTYSFYGRYNDNILDFAEKLESRYNPNGTPLLERWSSFQDDKWTVGGEWNYQYDAGGMLTGGTAFADGVTYPLTVSGTLENLEITLSENGKVFFKRVLHYDPVTMKQKGYETYVMDDDGTLKPDFKYEYTYDAAGRLATEIEIDNESHYYKTVYEYNASGQKILETSYKSDGADSDYEEYKRTEYKYTDGKLLEIAGFSYNTIAYTTTFSYTSGTASIAAGLNIYASGGQIFIEMPAQGETVTLRLFDMSGRNVLTTSATPGVPVQAGTLPDGVYIYRISSGKTAYGGKLKIGQ